MGMWLNKVGLPKLMIGCCLLVLIGPLQVAALEISNAPGNIIPVGDVDYHVLCTGSGSSTIILESGLGGNYLDWSLLQPLLSSDQVTVCSYDRAGYGWSSMGNKPRIADKTAAKIALMQQGQLRTFESMNEFIEDSQAGAKAEIEFWKRVG